MQCTCKEGALIYFTDVSFIRPLLKTSSNRQMQLNTTVNICIAKRCFYMASLNGDMFRPLYRPSSGCFFVCFPRVTTQCGCILHSPAVGFSLLVFEVS
jgi:hypothetical protein